MKSGASDRELLLIGKLWLAAEIIAVYGRVRWSLWRASVPGVITALRAPGRPFGAWLLTDAAHDGHRLGAAVVKTLSPMPSASRCLMRSLVLLRLLTRRGIHGSVVIAVAPSEETPLDAHAWVEVDGRPLLAPAPNHDRLVTL